MSQKQEEARFNPFGARPLKSTNIRKMIAVVSGKGGVGKSMMTSLLASAAQQQGFSTGILDADVTGPSIGKMFNITSKATVTDEGMRPAESKTGIKILSANMLLESDDTPVLWRGPMIANAVKEFYTKAVWNDLDVMFIDMPPGTGDVPLTVYQSLPLDGIVMVTTPQDLVSMVVSKAVSMANQMKVPILGVIENMSYLKCPSCDEIIYPFGQSRTQAMCDQYQLELLQQVPINPELTKASDQGCIEDIVIKDIQETVKKLLFTMD